MLFALSRFPAIPNVNGSAKHYGGSVVIHINTFKQYNIIEWMGLSTDNITLSFPIALIAFAQVVFFFYTIFKHFIRLLHGCLRCSSPLNDRLSCSLPLSLSVRLFLLSLNVPMPNYTRTNKCNLKMYALLLRRFTQFVLLLLFFIFYFVSILFGCTATH